jgi:hypothetical protein
MYTTSRLGSMEIKRLYIEAISAATKQRNQMPLPPSAAAPIVLVYDVTTFLNNYESVAAITSTDPTGSDAVKMFPYSCMEDYDVRDTIVMMRGYMERDCAVVRTVRLDEFHLAESRFRDNISTRRYLDDLYAEFGS